MTESYSPQYQPKTWINGDTQVNATNLNHIETGISNNVSDINILKKDMTFKGTVDNLPNNPHIGDVYQATVSNIIDNNKVGDLLVCTADNPVAWHIIPSGDETNGTVTSVQAGDGLTAGQLGTSGGAITSAGSLSIDTNYLANSNRNGLLSKELYAKLYSIDYDLAVNRDYNRLQNIPTTAQYRIYQQTGEDDAGVMSQNAITTALDTKSNVGHTHQLSDTPDLPALLATVNDNDEDTEYTKASSNTHSHGLITRDGRFLSQGGGSYAGENQYLKTNASGTIISTNVIPSGQIQGTTFSGISLSDINTNVSAINDILTPTNSEERMTKAATEDHSHPAFYDDSVLIPGNEGGFVPRCQYEQNPEDYILNGNGEWVSSTDRLIDGDLIQLLYPVGSYYITSDGDFNPNRWSSDANVTIPANNPFGTWVRVTRGLTLVSASSPAADNPQYPANKTAGSGAANGGSTTVTLKQNETPLATHSHDFNAYFYVRHGDENSSKSNYWTIQDSNGSDTKGSNVKFNDKSSTGYKYNAKDTKPAAEKVKYAYKTVAMEHYPDTVKIHGPTDEAGSSSASPHNNMQPYMNVYMWHRIA